MCAQGDKEIRQPPWTLDGVKRTVEEKSFSAISVGSFPFAAIKNFNYQLETHHCKPSSGYTNTLWIWHPGRGPSTGGRGAAARAPKPPKGFAGAPGFVLHQPGRDQGVKIIPEELSKLRSGGKARLVVQGEEEDGV
jgi:hypothetical protein